MAQRTLSLLATLLTLALIAFAGRMIYNMQRTLGEIRNELKPILKIMPLRFGGGSSVFNSWENKQGDPSRCIEAWGLEKGNNQWGVEGQNKQTGFFTVRFHPEEVESTLSSSGGYITFYENPVDRLGYKSLRFRCRATDVAGRADVGVRIVVDDPHGFGDRELAVYQVDSLAKRSDITSDWKAYEIELSDFTRREYRPPFPNGIDANAINKVVFFVDLDKARECGEATLWFSDIAFVPSEGD